MAAAAGDHIKVLVRSHAAGDDAAFYAVALQVAARAARQGHGTFASELKQAIESSQHQPVARQQVTSIVQPRGDLAELVIASFPEVRLRDLVGPAALMDQVRLMLSEQRQRQSLLDHGFAPMHRVLLEGPPARARR